MNPPNTDKLIEYLNREKNISKYSKKCTLMTDITCLMVLPQKVAAGILNLSESMLCKKFKELNNISDKTQLG